MFRHKLERELIWCDALFESQIQLFLIWQPDWTKEREMSRGGTNLVALREHLITSTFLSYIWMENENNLYKIRLNYLYLAWSFFNLQICLQAGST